MARYTVEMWIVFNFFNAFFRAQNTYDYVFPIQLIIREKWSVRSKRIWENEVRKTDWISKRKQEKNLK